VKAAAGKRNKERRPNRAWNIFRYAFCFLLRRDGKGHTAFPEGHAGFRRGKSVFFTMEFPQKA
jgi:hypothetical protein